MKYAVLVGKGLANGTPNGWKNMGDYIQSLAGAQFLPQIDEYIDRENPNIIGEDVKMIMNAWYMWNPEKFPSCKRIIPLPVSIHISPMIQDRLFAQSNILEWFKKNEPIGCRDKGTVELLTSKGIVSYFSGCLTLTLGKKYKYDGIHTGLVFVDPYLPRIRGKELSILDYCKVFLFCFCHLKTYIKLQKKFNNSCCQKKLKILKRMLYTAIFMKTYNKIFSLKELLNAEYITHIIKVGDGTQYQTEEEKMILAEQLVKKYASSKLVVTGRIHCALPCLGIETPVIFTVGYSLEEGSPSSSAGRFGGLMYFFNVLRIAKIHIQKDFDFPVTNKDLYKKYALELEKKCEEFIQGDS